MGRNIKRKRPCTPRSPRCGASRSGLPFYLGKGGPRGGGAAAAAAEQEQEQEQEQEGKQQQQQKQHEGALAFYPRHKATFTLNLPSQEEGGILPRLKNYQSIKN